MPYHRSRQDRQAPTDAKLSAPTKLPVFNRRWSAAIRWDADDKVSYRFGQHLTAALDKEPGPLYDWFRDVRRRGHDVMKFVPPQLSGIQPLLPSLRTIGLPSAPISLAHVEFV